MDTSYEPVTKAPPGTRVFLRPIATPLPLGFLGLAGGTFTLAGIQLDWISMLEAPIVGVVLLTFTFPLLLVAAIYGFLARDAMAATGMGVLAGAWLAIGYTMANTVPGFTSGALGLLLLAAGVALVIPLLSAGLGKLAASAVLAFAALRFFLTGAYELSSDAAWRTAAGVVGLILAAVAVCAALAFESELLRKRPLLPTLRRGEGRDVMTEPAEEETADLHREAGVRRRL